MIKKEMQQKAVLKIFLSVLSVKVCLLSFGAYDYKGDDFTAIYKEG